MSLGTATGNQEDPLAENCDLLGQKVVPAWCLILSLWQRLSRLAGGLEIALQLRKRTLRLAKIAGLESLAKRGKVILDGAGTVRTSGRIRRALIILQQLLDARVGRLRTRQVAGLKRTGELVEVLTDLLERILLILLRQVRNQVRRES